MTYGALRAAHENNRDARQLWICPDIIKAPMFAGGGDVNMHLVQLFVPAASQVDVDVEDVVARVQNEMTKRYGGATAYINSPARGLWSNGGKPEEDEIIVIEVMVDDLDRDWWDQYRRELEHLLRQDELLVRALPVERL